MSDKHVLVAGATGALGQHVVEQLQQQGCRVRALGRRREALRRLPADEVFQADLTDPASLDGCCDGIDIVVSCAGASMRLKDLGDRRSFREVDAAGNERLLDAARRAGVFRFVYVSLYGAAQLLDTEYARAHEAFVEALERSGMSHTVIRPTGYFFFLAEILEMARGGFGVVIGSGTARTNPVHEVDVAAACVRALEQGAREVAVGGPDVFTREEIVTLAFEVLGRRPKVMHLPPWLFRGVAALIHPLNRRIAGLLDFGAAVSCIDVVAPPVGTRDLRSYFAARA